MTTTVVTPDGLHTEYEGCHGFVDAHETLYVRTYSAGLRSKSVERAEFKKGEWLSFEVEA